MGESSPTLGARRGVPGAYSCVFRGRNLSAVARIEPRQFFWDMHTFIDEQGINPTTESVVLLAKAFGVPVSLAYGRRLMQEHWDSMAQAEMDDFERITVRRHRERHENPVQVATTIIQDAKRDDTHLDWSREPLTRHARDIRRRSLEHLLELARRTQPLYGWVALVNLLEFDGYRGELASDARAVKDKLEAMVEAHDEGELKARLLRTIEHVGGTSAC